MSSESPACTTHHHTWLTHLYHTPSHLTQQPVPHTITPDTTACTTHHHTWHNSLYHTPSHLTQQPVPHTITPDSLSLPPHLTHHLHHHIWHTPVPHTTTPDPPACTITPDSPACILGCDGDRAHDKFSLCLTYQGFVLPGCRYDNKFLNTKPAQDETLLDTNCHKRINTRDRILQVDILTV